jgi:hypothetical protein
MTPMGAINRDWAKEEAELSEGGEMSQEDLERILSEVSHPFDEEISEAGGKLEALLNPGKKSLVDDLDILHWKRTAALVARAYEAGKEKGLVLANQFKSSQEEDS